MEKQFFTSVLLNKQFWSSRNHHNSKKSSPAITAIKNPNTMYLIMDKMNMFKQLNYPGQKNLKFEF